MRTSHAVVDMLIMLIYFAHENFDKSQRTTEKRNAKDIRYKQTILK
jgi:hypothetical protein